MAALELGPRQFQTRGKEFTHRPMLLLSWVPDGIRSMNFKWHCLPPSGCLPLREGRGPSSHPASPPTPLFPVALHPQSFLPSPPVIKSYQAALNLLIPSSPHPVPRDSVTHKLGMQMTRHNPTLKELTVMQGETDE